MRIYIVIFRPEISNLVEILVRRLKNGVRDKIKKFDVFMGQSQLQAVPIEGATTTGKKNVVAGDWIQRGRVTPRVYLNSASETRLLFEFFLSARTRCYAVCACCVHGGSFRRTNLRTTWSITRILTCVVIFERTLSLCRHLGRYYLPRIARFSFDFPRFHVKCSEKPKQIAVWNWTSKSSSADGVRSIAGADVK